MKSLKLTQVLILSLLLSAIISMTGCTSYATFATRTTQAVAKIDTDPNQPKITIGKDRFEGFFGPAFDTGAAPSSFAFMDSNASITNPEVSQLYATGNAAKILLGKPVNISDTEMTGNRKPMFFGVRSTSGLSLGLSPGNSAPEFVFGYDREEVSIIPIQKPSSDDGDEDSAIYPSVIGVIRLQTQTDDSDNKIGIRSQTVFATGQAAEHYASTTDVSQLVTNILDTEFESVAARYDAAQALAYEIMIDFYDVDPSKRDKVYNEAAAVGVLGTASKNSANFNKLMGYPPETRVGVFQDLLVGGDASDLLRIKKLRLFSAYLNANLADLSQP
ncbi:MAG: hypothetical protein AAF212_09780 [Verrucomicrobiota bacterium]